MRPTLSVEDALRFREACARTWSAIAADIIAAEDSCQMEPLTEAEKLEGRAEAIVDRVCDERAPVLAVACKAPYLERLAIARSVL